MKARAHCPTRPPVPSLVLAARLLVVFGILAGCGTGASSPRPTLPTLPTSAATVRPTVAGTRPPTIPVATPTGPGATPAWPAGWDAAFCIAFEQVVIAQELAVDIGRALAEGARADALALSRELRQTAPAATQLLEALPDWPPAGDAVERLVSIMAVGERLGARYERHIETGSEEALERVQELIGEMRPLVVDALADLDELRDAAALSCPGRELTIESP